MIMEDQSVEKQKRRKGAATKSKKDNSNAADSDGTAKVGLATGGPIVTNATGFDGQVAFNTQPQPIDSKMAQLPNVSQFLSVPNETQTMSMNGAQPLPPISTMAGRFCNPNFPNLGAFPGIGLPNITNVAFPAGMPMGESDAKQNANEMDPSAIPFGVVSVPNLNFVPFHVGEMSLFTDPNGSVCAAPSGFHVPFHVPFSGIISIPSAVLTTPLDGNNQTTNQPPPLPPALPQPAMQLPPTAPAPAPGVIDPKMDVATHPPFGVQLGNAQTLFSGTQSPALFGTQLPTFTAAFVSQPFALLGPSAVNVGGGLPGGVPPQNGVPMPGQPCAQLQLTNAAPEVGACAPPIAVSSQVDKLPDSDEQQIRITSKSSRKRRLNLVMTQPTVAMKMSSLEEVFAQFVDTDADADAKPPQSTSAESKKRPRPQKSSVKGPNTMTASAQQPSNTAKRAKPKRARAGGDGEACEKPHSTLDDEILELFRSVVEGDGTLDAEPTTAPDCGKPRANRNNTDANSISIASHKQRARSTLNDAQRSALEAAFAESGRLSKERVAQIAVQVGLAEATVLKYFASARRRAAKTEHPSAVTGGRASAAAASSIPSRPPKRRPLRGTAGPITNFMSRLNDKFFDDVIVDESAICRSSTERTRRPHRNHSRVKSSVAAKVEADSGQLGDKQVSQAAICNGALMQQHSDVKQHSAMSKCDDENENISSLCPTDISAMLANVLPSGGDTDADADADLPADIVLPTIDTSLLPALDSGGGLNILSAATAMLPTADELSLNLDLTVSVADHVKPSG